MTIRQIRQKEWQNGMRYCTFCKRLGRDRVGARWRDWYMQLACEDHKNHLVQRTDSYCGDSTEAELQISRRYGI